MIMFKIGDKVTYKGKEKGIIKGFSTFGDVYVVFNCGGDWENYLNYTAARCNELDLIKGWEPLPF